jgi:hypothetical protein
VTGGTDFGVLTFSSFAGLEEDFLASDGAASDVV